ncbi:MAG: hypothetical protein RI580_02040 [Halothece sp. Uz-M2-17]|nr:hypothetical protein [Halothece sp. Uz-M2-17]
MTSNYRFQEITSSPPHKNTPTVPMSVYRELAGELQSAQQQLQDLKDNNHHLHQENQTLRLEIKKLVQSVQRLENNLNHWDQTTHTQQRTNPVPTKESSSYTPAASTQEHWFSHEQTHYVMAEESQDGNQEINGWFVIAAIVMIIFTFSGIGFMIARPLLNQSGEQ